MARCRLRTLLLDIETAPNVAYIWGLFKENIPLDRLVQSGYTMCWSAQWLGETEVHFASRRKRAAPAKPMLRPLHDLLDAADVVVNYNGARFDVPTVQKDFVKYGFAPPAPFKQIDLLQIVRRQFRFVSNKLDYVAQALDLGSKVKHRGFELWVKCMNGDPAAWKEMEEYNRGDVALLEKLYRRLQPWITKHPNVSAYTGDECCPKCGSTKYQRRGTAIATTQVYQRFQCGSCGGWFRSAKAEPKKGAPRMANIVAA